MDDDSSTLQTLASVLSGGLQGYVDSQNQQPVYVVAPSPNTAYGTAGQGQSTPSSLGAVLGLPPAMLLIGAVALFFFLKK